MTSDAMQKISSSGPQRSRFADVALIATLVGVLVVLFVSMTNQKELARLSARVQQLETLASTVTAVGGTTWNKIYEVKTATAPVKGVATAPVTIVEFAEFQCPFCMRARPTLEQIRATYKDQVRFVWKHLPLVSIHSHAMDASIAAEAARNQGRFWEYHDKLFANQAHLEPNDLRKYAQELGLDLDQFDKDRDDQKLRTAVLDDMAEAKSLGVRSTPTFLINGRLVSGAMPFETFSTIIEEELAKAPTSVVSDRSLD
jgi:protein-disulfide isomerase